MIQPEMIFDCLYLAHRGTPYSPYLEFAQYLVTLIPAREILLRINWSFFE